MDTIPQVAQKIQRVMTRVAEQLGKETGFVQRQRKLGGAAFAQSVVFGWWGNPEASLGEMQQMAANTRVAVSRQAIAQRFTPAAARFMQALLGATLEEAVAGPRVSSQAFEAFEGVYIIDSSCVSLPAQLTDQWAGCGGSQGSNACLKLSVLWEMLHGKVAALELMAGKTHDQQAEAATRPLPGKSLRLADLGYYKLSTLARMSGDGEYWISKYKHGTVLWHDGQRLTLVTYLQTHHPATLDCAIGLGARLRLPARLVAVRVSDATLERRRADLVEWERKKQCRASDHMWFLLAWDIYLTNIPDTLLETDAVVVLARYRWQIELLFKLWKSEGQIDEWRTQNPWRILCEIYGKLIALMIHHWVFLVAAWRYLDRSPTRALHTTRHFAWEIARKLPRYRALCTTLSDLAHCLSTCRMSRSKASPRTFQRLEALS